MNQLDCIRSTFVMLALAATGPTLAHHSFAAEFDGSKPVTLTGQVTRIEWSNPHAYLFLDVKDEAGNVSSWSIELGNPLSLTRLGWKRTTVQVGDQLTVDGSLGRYKPNLANARSAILLRTGERLGAASSQTGP